MSIHSIYEARCNGQAGACTERLRADTPDEVRAIAKTAGWRWAQGGKLTLCQGCLYAPGREVLRGGAADRGDPDSPR